MSLAGIWTQFFPPRNSAPLTETNLPRQQGKVFIVTGGSSGIGYELSRILYGTGGKVYVMTRSRHNAEAAIARIETFYSKSQEGRAEYTLGSLEFVEMDLLDLASVKRAAEDFLSREGPDGRLDVLFNNAGTGALKNAPSSPQGHEYHFSINVLGGFLLTRLLAPILSRTACNLPPNSVRVVWSASVMVDMMSPESGIKPQFLQDTRTVQDVAELYATSKMAGWFLASEFTRRQASSNSGVVFVAGNPGNYVTNVWRHTSTLVYYLFRPVLRAPVHGAETYLWMASSPSVTIGEASTGRYAICDGRWHPAPRSDLVLALGPFKGRLRSSKRHV